MEQQHESRGEEVLWSYSNFVKENPAAARTLETVLQYSGFFAPARLADRDLAIESGYAAASLAALAHNRILLDDRLDGEGAVWMAPTNCMLSDITSNKHPTTPQDSAAKGSSERMEMGQKSPMGRYPSLSSQVQGLLDNMSLSGTVLDCCGADGDAVYTVLSAHDLTVTTNDLNPRLTAGSHIDASTEDFFIFFMEPSRRPDWIVTSPPYKNAFDTAAVNECRAGGCGVQAEIVVPRADESAWCSV